MQVFLSYTRIKDQFNAVTDFHAHLENELKQSAPGTSVFFDKRNLNDGGHFPDELSAELQQADVLIPLLSPAWLQSDWCRREFELFTSDRQDVGRLHRVLPVLWVATPQVSAQSTDPIARALASIQRPDWTQRRHESWTNPNKLANMAKLAESTASLAVAPSIPITSANKSGAARLAEAK